MRTPPVSAFARMSLRRTPMSKSLSRRLTLVPSESSNLTRPPKWMSYESLYGGRARGEVSWRTIRPKCPHVPSRRASTTSPTCSPPSPGSSKPLSTSSSASTPPSCSCAPVTRTTRPEGSTSSSPSSCAYRRAKAVLPVPGLPVSTSESDLSFGSSPRSFSSATASLSKRQCAFASRSPTRPSSSSSAVRSSSAASSAASSA
mmetsp:Transcript_437/g.1369  ORF Transcript_437/g.1369 Transcript_437/m.1369 type:complete len:202 (-) Transcript_437:55-660(-)